MASLHPSTGARMVIARDAAPPDEVRYRVDVYEPEAHHSGSASLVDGALTWGAFDTPPPDWALQFLGRLLLGLAKKHASDGDWPRKLTRWRAP